MAKNSIVDLIDVNDLTVGFVGFGEVAGQFTKGFYANGVKRVVAYDKMLDHEVFGPSIIERSEKLKVTLVSELKELAEKVDMIFITVPANNSLEVLEQLENELNTNQLYVDLTASTPSAKAGAAKRLSEKGIEFIDGAIMGPVIAKGFKVPILLSGNVSLRLAEVLNNLGMNTESASEDVGKSSAIKLVRSIYMKGISGLFTEMLEASEHFGVSDDVISSIEDTMAGKSFEETMNRLVTSNAIHSERRAAELDGSIEMLEEANLDCKMTKATKGKLIDITNKGLKAKFNNEIPNSWRQVMTKEEV